MEKGQIERKIESGADPSDLKGVEEGGGVLGANVTRKWRKKGKSFCGESSLELPTRAQEQRAWAGKLMCHKLMDHILYLGANFWMDNGHTDRRTYCRMQSHIELNTTWLEGKEGKSGLKWSRK